ncbi:hypothetical protein HanRHA438_Chr11g0498381 [Helianthus annuus]|nr:hypothetical protein HanRHA438_Chr11g0498381 [Helianthus annuus]
MFRITVEQSAAGAGAPVCCAELTGDADISTAEMQRMRMAAVVAAIVAGNVWLWLCVCECAWE